MLMLLGTTTVCRVLVVSPCAGGWLSVMDARAGRPFRSAMERVPCYGSGRAAAHRKDKPRRGLSAG